MWVIVLFALGVVVAALIAIVYTAIALMPGLTAPAGVDPDRLRLSAVVLAIVGSLLSALQLVALVGLALGRDWGRVLATIACVAWALTCIGLPVSLLVISSLWARRNAPIG
jgi:hypothetical protein